MLHFHGLLSKFSLATAKLIELQRYLFWNYIGYNMSDGHHYVQFFPHSDFVSVNNLVRMYKTATGILVDYSL